MEGDEAEQEDGGSGLRPPHVEDGPLRPLQGDVVPEACHEEPEADAETEVEAHQAPLSNGCPPLQTGPESKGEDELSKLQASLPKELLFLASVACNPDLTTEENQATGNIRSARPGHHRRSNSHVERARDVTRQLVFSWSFQAFVYGVIFFDLVLTSVFLLNPPPGDEEPPIYLVADYLILFILTTDVTARFFVERWRFLRSRMNIFEVVLVPINMIEVLLLRNVDLPVSLLKALRPIFRLIRLVRAVLRTAGKGHGYLQQLRQTVSGSRIRFTEDGFDLDLAYITSGIIAMSQLGVGREGILFNPYLEVARFLNERHGNKYLLLNTTMERRYPLGPFFDRYLHFPIPKDGVPMLDNLLRLVQVLDAFLKADPQHLLAAHSFHGQGRVSIVVLAMLLYSGEHQTVNSAIAVYEHMRVAEESRGLDNTQTLDSASQRRLLEYFAHLCHQIRARPQPQVREARLRRVQLFGLSNSLNVDLWCFGGSGTTRRNSVASIKTQSLHSGRTNDSFGRMISRAGLEGLKEADELEENDEEALMDAVLEMPEAKVQEQISRMLEEAAPDSMASGCLPSVGVPIACSDEQSQASAGVTSPERESGSGAPCVWDLDNTRVKGELRLEIHRRRKDRLQEPQETEPARSRLLRLLLRCAGCCRRRRSHEAHQGTGFEGGMLFSCWLHTSFLELDEPHVTMPSRLRPRNLVTVVLDRFHLDKAANAPSLRSHSAALKLQLEFEVEHRVDLCKMSSADWEGASLLLSSEVEHTPEYSLGWLTWVSEKLWPSFQTGFEKLMRNSILPSVEESLPAPLKGFRLAQFSLGDAYPKFGPISACSKRHDGFEVEIDFMLDYATDASILLEHAMAHLGIDYVSLKGMLSVKFRPLLSELPVFVALQLLFLNAPEVVLEFKTPGDIANFSLVRSLIFSTIDRALYDLMVLPNVININWGDESSNREEGLSFQSVMPTSVVRIGVVQAQGLRTDRRFKLLPDVRVQAHLGDQTGQTTTITQTTDPVWKEEFDFLVYDERQHISAGVFDVDFTGRNKEIGKVSKLSVSEIVATSEEGIWVDVMAASDEAYGQLHLKAEMFDLVADLHKVEAHLPPAVLRELHGEGGGNACEWAEGCGGAAARPASSPRSPRAPAWPLGILDGSRPGGSGRAASPSSTSLQPSDHRGGAVAVLVCEVSGGRLPPEVGKPGEVDLRMSLGSAWGARRCAEAPKVDPGPIGERGQRSIERLAERGLDADKIADALGEDISVVHRIMRKRGWNMEMLQKVPILLYQDDLRTASGVKLEVLARGSCVAFGEVPILKLLQGFGTRFEDVVACVATRDAAKVEVDIKFRLFSMVARLG